MGAVGVMPDVGVGLEFACEAAPEPQAASSTSRHINGASLEALTRIFPSLRSFSIHEKLRRLGVVVHIWEGYLWRLPGCAAILAASLFADDEARGVLFVGDGGAFVIDQIGL